MRFDLPIVLIGIIGLQALISCSPDVIEDETSPSSSSLLSSSSSKTPSSSSSLDCSTISSSSISEDLCLDFDPDTEVEHYGKMKKQFCDERDGKKYVYVQIGEQIWMAENLNHDVCGSKCGEVEVDSYLDGSGLFDTDTEICDEYGRLYDWETAITVCPAGWHLPSVEELDALVKYVDPNWVSHTNNVASTKLKATSGWKLDQWIYNCRENVATKSAMEDYISCGINGTDDYGFSALPGGIGCNNYNRFYGLTSSYWWGATGSSDGLFANHLSMTNHTDYAYRHSHVRVDFLSVRCVKSVEETLGE